MADTKKKEVREGAEETKTKAPRATATDGSAGQTKEPHRQTVRGVVVSDKMAKTRIIEVQRKLTHSLYHKGIKRASRIFVHDEKNETKVGDLVRAESTRPLSKNKTFRIIQVIEKRAE